MGVTTATSMQEWRRDDPCCTNRPYDHIHPPKALDTPQPLIVDDLAYDGCPTCQSAGDEPCVTAGGNVKDDWHKTRNE